MAGVEMLLHPCRFSLLAELLRGNERVRNHAESFDAFQARTNEKRNAG